MKPSVTCSPLGVTPCRFPLEGGTGGIWKKVAKLLPPERQRYGCQLAGLDKDKQVATFADGRQVRCRAGPGQGWYRIKTKLVQLGRDWGRQRPTVYQHVSAKCAS